MLPEKAVSGGGKAWQAGLEKLELNHCKSYGGLLQPAKLIVAVPLHNPWQVGIVKPVVVGLQTLKGIEGLNVRLALVAKLTPCGKSEKTSW